jgi:two-component system KDP operon response regulator KdpE
LSRILVIEDDAALRGSLRSILQRSSYDVTTAADGEAGARELTADLPDAVLLDIGLPFVDGWEILRRLDGRRIPPVIVISARGEAQDKVRALDLGADDYLAKPFDAEELLARIRAVLRRAAPGPGTARAVTVGPLRVDLRAAVVHLDGREVHLSPTEYGLLAEMARHVGQVLDHRTLLRRVWGPAYGDERNYLRTYIQRLRAKLEAEPSEPQLLVTVGTRGYRLGPAPPHGPP